MGDVELPSNGATAPQPAAEAPTQPAGETNGAAPTVENASAAPPPTPAAATDKGDGSAEDKSAKAGRSEASPAAEAQPTVSEIKAFWDGENGAYAMVRDYVNLHEADYNTGKRNKRHYARSASLNRDDPKDQKKITSEMFRRKRVLEALEIVEIALKVARGEKTDWKKGAKSGCFQKLSPDGKTVEREVWTHWAVEPIIDEVRKFAKETEKKDGNDQPTARAEQALKILKVLEPRLVAITTPDPDKRKGFLIEPNLKNIEIKKAQESSYTYALHLIDAVLEPFGQKLEYEDAEIEIGGKKTRRKRLKLDVLSKIDPTCRTGEFGELGGRLSRLSILLNQYEEVDASRPEARACLAAMIYDEAAQIDISKIKSSRYPNLAEELAGLNDHKAILHQYRDDLLGKVKRAIYQYYHPGEPIDPVKLQKIPLSGARLFRILYFANICEDHVGINSESLKLDMEAPFKDVLNQSKVAGEIFDSDINAIMYLAGSKQAGVILKDELEFDPESLKEQPITAYAKRVIEGIDKKRPDDKKMTEEEKKGYRAVFEELQTLGEEAGRESKLGGWIKALGILALILGPSVFKMFDEGVEASQGQAPPG